MKKYYSLEEFESLCLQHKKSGDLAYFTREGMIRPRVYISSLPVYVQKFQQEKPMIIGYCRLSGYYDVGDVCVPMLDNLLSGKFVSLCEPICNTLKIYPHQLQEMQIFCWQVQPSSLFHKFPKDMCELQENWKSNQIDRFVLEQPLEIRREIIFITQYDVEFILLGSAGGYVQRITDFKNALSLIIDIAKENGLSIDPQKLPGKKIDWINLVLMIDPKFKKFSSKTLEDYFDETPYKFPQGRRKCEIPHEIKQLQIILQKR